MQIFVRTRSQTHDYYWTEIAGPRRHPDTGWRPNENLPSMIAAIDDLGATIVGLQREESWTILITGLASKRISRGDASSPAALLCVGASPRVASGLMTAAADSPVRRHASARAMFHGVLATTVDDGVTENTKGVGYLVSPELRDRLIDEFERRASDGLDVGDVPMLASRIAAEHDFLFEQDVQPVGGGFIVKPPRPTTSILNWDQREFESAAQFELEESNEVDGSSSPVKRFWKTLWAKPAPATHDDSPKDDPRQ